MTSTAIDRAPRVPASIWRTSLTGWDVFLIAVIVAIVVYGSLTSPYFLSASNISMAASDYVRIALIALVGMLLIIVGDIDLSVASTLGLASVVLGLASAAGLSAPLCLLAAMTVGVLAGAFNGLLVAVIGIPSIVVTIGTLGLYRGIAYGVYGSRAESGFPEAIVTIGSGSIPGTLIPWSLVIFAVLAAIVGIILHLTVLGRQMFAMGLNPEAARFSGVQVWRVRFGLFVASGAVAALAGVIYTGQIVTARADNGTGLELQVIAAVLLGGISILGGRGSILGLLLSLVALTLLRNILALNGTGTAIEMLLVGLLMVSAVVLPQVFSNLGNSVAAKRTSRSSNPTAPSKG